MSDNSTTCIVSPSATARAGPVDTVRAIFARATQIAVEQGVLTTSAAAREVPLERPKDAKHGDLATNLCFVLAKAAKTNPRALAERLCACVRQADSDGAIAKLEVAGPGFVNLFLAPHCWQAGLVNILQQGDTFGQSRSGAGQRVLIEFVSANPTGPLHVGHGRGAVLGDTLAAVMRAAGFAVSTEYYINNVGNQINKLGESVWHWLRAADRRAAALAVWAADEPVAFPDGFPDGFPEDGYRGAYIAATAQQLAADPAIAGCAALTSWTDASQWAALDRYNPTGRADNRAVSVRAWQLMIARIAADLSLIGIRFDKWQSERTLHGLDVGLDGGADPVADGSHDRVSLCAQRLVQAGWAYPQPATDGDQPAQAAGSSGAGPSDAQLVPSNSQAVFFAGTREDIPKAFRDSKDRVIVRSDGRPTYFAADIAYHDDKLARGFTHLINVLGADHHGYVPRLKGVLHALGDMRRCEGDPNAQAWSGERLEVPLVQMVALLRDGKPVPMGKRSGEFVTLADVVEEVTTLDNPHSGADAVRFTFLSRKADAQIDFDLEVARRASLDNPVYYVQYGHARLASVLARAQGLGKGLDAQKAVHSADLTALTLDAERELAIFAADYPEVVARAARSREPHQVAYYLRDLCAAFHAYYSQNKATARVISDDVASTQARLTLVAALAQVVRNGLILLGITAPDRMANLAGPSQADDDADAAADPTADALTPIAAVAA